MDTESKRVNASEMAFSQPRTYSICIGYSISVASQPEIRADAFAPSRRATAERGDQFTAGKGAPAGRL